MTEFETEFVKQMKRHLRVIPAQHLLDKSLVKNSTKQKSIKILGRLVYIIIPYTGMINASAMS